MFCVILEKPYKIDKL